MPKKTEPKKRRISAKQTQNTEQPREETIEEIKKQIEAVSTDINIDYNGLDKIIKEIDNTLEPINEVSAEVKNLTDKKAELENLMQSDSATINEFIGKGLKDAETLKEKINKIMTSQNKDASARERMTNLWNGCNSFF